MQVRALPGIRPCRLMVGHLIFIQETGVRFSPRVPCPRKSVVDFRSFKAETPVRFGPGAPWDRTSMVDGGPLKAEMSVRLAPIPPFFSVRAGRQTGKAA